MPSVVSGLVCLFVAGGLASLLASIIVNLAIGRYRKPGISFFVGYAAFSILFLPNVYTERGNQLRKWYLYSIAAFVLCGLLASIAQVLQPPGTKLW